MAMNTLQIWHKALRERDPSALDVLLADDAVFHSPVVHRPQEGKALTKMYLTGAFHVLSNDSFQYVREVVADDQAVLEFTTEIDGIQINGVDLIRWNADGQITEFKVMLRPLKAINLVHAKMGALLKAVQG